MNSLLEFLSHQTILLLFALVGLGMLIGRLRLGGVTLGAVAVLFLAIGISAWGASAGHKLVLPEILGALGLTLFTFSIGVMSGPGLFASLRRGLGPIVAMVGALLAAAAVAVLAGRLLGLAPHLVAGSFAGAIANAPALAAVREAAGNDPLTTIGYAVTCLFGMIGMLGATALALRLRDRDTDGPAPLANCTVRVETDHPAQHPEVEQRYGRRIRFSRVQHGGSRYPAQAPTDADVLECHDLVAVVGPADVLEQVAAELGHASSHALPADRSALDFRRITLSRPQLVGHTIAELALTRRFGATVTRVRRGDVDMLATDQLVLQPGDRVRVTAPREQMQAVSDYLGDSESGLSDINPVALGGGLVLGILLGQLVLPLPWAEFSIGSAAGTLLVGIVFGQRGRIGPIVTTLPHMAAQALSEFGLLVFLAVAGTLAGGQFELAVSSGAWLKILALGLLITTTVALAISIVMRWMLGMGYGRLAGVLAGIQSQPAALAFANSRSAGDSRVAQGHALVYAAAMITNAVLGQILGGL